MNVKRQRHNLWNVKTKGHSSHVLITHSRSMQIIQFWSYSWLSLSMTRTYSGKHVHALHQSSNVRITCIDVMTLLVTLQTKCVQVQCLHQ